MNKEPLISLAIPIHNMANKEYFLDRCIDSIHRQTYQNFEIVTTEKGRMAENSNAAIKECTGDIVKVLYLDDYLAHNDSLQEIVDEWPFKWLVTGCNHDNGEQKFNNHYADFQGIPHGVNTIGSPSVLAFENKKPLLFDEKMTWLLDVDLYQRLYARYGLPTIIDDINVTIGIHDGQTTNILTDKEKLDEEVYLKNK